MEKLIQSFLSLEKKRQPLERQVEEKEAAVSTAVLHPDRPWDVSLQSMTCQAQTHRFFGAQERYTFQKQWKKGRCKLQMLFYHYVNNRAGPSHLARAVYFRCERSLTGWGRRCAPPVSPFFLCVDRGRRKNAYSAAVFHIWKTQVRLSLPCLGPMEKAWGRDGGPGVVSTGSPFPVHGICQCGKESRK